ncbi:hypothetical protein [Peribacillus glennii]|uniref:Uncharacterized protein n=1 Tax=Peribacillus glennii TaxID=2303991 RepID=A0A372L7J7_9BACI|nr:hypothetical protein [Peribacillus glennii]RFU60882.1 hypothetical protein D0466_20085 [Peribacillus glennii]
MRPLILSINLLRIRLHIVTKIGNNKNFHFYVLCGTNQTLYQRIAKLKKNNITAMGYIDSREKMNALYD